MDSTLPLYYPQKSKEKIHPKGNTVTRTNYLSARGQHLRDAQDKVSRSPGPLQRLRSRRPTGGASRPTDEGSTDHEIPTGQPAAPSAGYFRLIGKLRVLPRGSRLHSRASSQPSHVGSKSEPWARHVRRPVDRGWEAQRGVGVHGGKMSHLARARPNGQNLTQGRHAKR